MQDKRENCEDYCYLLVNDLGNVVCVDCGCFYYGKAIREELVKHYGEESWKEEYVRIKKNKRLARKRKLSEATAFNFDDEFRETKYFYE